MELDWIYFEGDNVGIRYRCKTDASKFQVGWDDAWQDLQPELLEDAELYSEYITALRKHKLENYNGNV